MTKSDYQHHIRTLIKRLDSERGLDKIKTLKRLVALMHEYQALFGAGVHSKAFDERFAHLASVLKDKGIDRAHAMAFRKAYATRQNYTIAIISPRVQCLLGASTRTVFLSDDTLIKMLAHHPELDLLPLFKNMQMILDNAVHLQKRDDVNVVYFTKMQKYYIATVKVTRDKTELYLTTIYETMLKEFERQMNKYE